MKLSKLFMLGCTVMALVFVSCSGEDGEDGDIGPTGPTGPTGPQGDKGDQGDPGEDKPNMDFYFQNGFKGYDGTQDASLNSAASSGNDEVLDLFYLNTLAQERRVVIRFDGISDIMNNALVDEGGTCSEAFHLNQAILYLYVTEENADVIPLNINIGFYGDEDPLFVENEVTWTAANTNDDWGDDGAESEGWTGPFADDSYSLKYFPSLGVDDSVGWIPIPLPRSVAEAWVCNPAVNNGLRLRLSGPVSGNGCLLKFASHENASEDLRPLLVIETEKIEAGEAAKGHISAKDQDWDSMSYEEKMAPLYRFMAAKN